MRFSLIPREMRFFDMLEEASVTITRAAGKFTEMLTKFDNIEQRADDLKKEEEACDAVVERILRALNLSFITPIDREDIHTLAMQLDDILDNLEQTAHRFVSFRITRPTPEAIALAGKIAGCCGHIEKAIHLSRNLKHYEEICKHLTEIGRLRNEADTVYRNVDAALFASCHGASTAIATGPSAVAPASAPANANGVDILTLIKWREIYYWLEETVDACKVVANVISEIVIKGS